jgi:hypothetical protein
LRILLNECGDVGAHVHTALSKPPPLPYGSHNCQRLRLAKTLKEGHRMTLLTEKCTCKLQQMQSDINSCAAWTCGVDDFELRRGVQYSHSEMSS